FEGTIPAQQYGAGTVMLWDQGTWEPQGSASKGYDEGKLRFDLRGAKLHGGWALIRTRTGRHGGGKKPSWLLIKERDAFARSGKAAAIVDAQPDSAASGRSMDSIARDRRRVWHSNRSPAANMQAGAMKPHPASRAPDSEGVDVKVPGAQTASLPR